MKHLLALFLLATIGTNGLLAQLDYDELNVEVDGRELNLHRVQATLSKRSAVFNPETQQPETQPYRVLDNNTLRDLHSSEYVLAMVFDDYLLLKEGDHGNGIGINFGAIERGKLFGIHYLDCVDQKHHANLATLAHPMVHYNIHQSVLDQTTFERSWQTDTVFGTANCKAEVVGEPLLNITRAEHYSEKNGDNEIESEGYVFDFTTDVKIRDQHGKTHSILVNAVGLKAHFMYVNDAPARAVKGGRK